VEVVAVEDEDQRCRTIIDGRPGLAVRCFRNAWTSFETSLAMHRRVITSQK